MAQEFQARGLSLPPDLADAASAWISQRGQASPIPRPTSTVPRSEGVEDEGDGDGESDGAPAAGEFELAETEHYDGELTAIFALPVTAQAQLVSNPNLFAPPVAPDVGRRGGGDGEGQRPADGVRQRRVRSPPAHLSA